MSLPYERLDRHVIGQGLASLGPKTRRLFERQERSYRPAIELPEPRAPRGGQVRRIRPAVQAEPNTPLLIRLVRNPFVQGKAAFRRQSIPERGVTLREARSGFRVELEAVLRSPRRARWLRPTEYRFRPQPRVRPTISDWITSSGGRE